MNMSLSTGNTDAAYSALPQAPDAVTAGHSRVPSAALDIEEQDALDDEELPPAPPVLDPRIRWILFMLGNAVLLPWNVMITASPYFMSRLTPEMGSTFTSYLSLAFNITNVYFLYRATVTAKQAVGPRRTRLTLIWVTVLVFLLTLSTSISTPPPSLFFAFVLANGVAQSAAGGYMQTAVVGMASHFGPIALQSVMAGQAAVGVLVSAAQLASTFGSLKVAPPPTPTPPTTPVAFLRVRDAVSATVIERDAQARAAGWFFGLATAFLLATIFAHAWLVRLPAYRAVMDPQAHHAAAHDMRLPSASPIIEAHPPRDERHALVGTPGDDKARILRIARANIVFEFAVAYVFTVTLAVFPPITLSVRPMSSSTNPLLFAGTHFLLFNVGDLTGRLLCSYPSLLMWSSRHLLSLSLARTLFIPAFLACNVPGSTAPFFSSDVSFFALLLVFGVSNGYVSTMCMIAAPNVERNPRLKGRREDVDTAAAVASFSLVSGLCVGAMASFVVRGIMCGCNPFLT